MKNELKTHTNNSLIKFSKIFPSNKFTSLYDKREGKLISKLFKNSKSKPKPSLSSYQSDFTSTSSLHTTDNLQSHSNTNNTQQLDKINTLYNELNLTSPHQNKSPNGAYVNHKESLTTNEKLLPSSSSVGGDKVIQRNISRKTISIPKLGMNVFQNENNNININKDYFTACVTNRNRNKIKCLDDDSCNSNSNMFLNKTEDNHNNNHNMKYTTVKSLCNEIKTITIIKPSTPDINATKKPNTKIPKQHSSSTCNKQLFKLKQRIQETIIKYKCKPKHNNNNNSTTPNHNYNCNCKCNCYSEMDSLLTELSNIIELN